MQVLCLLQIIVSRECSTNKFSTMLESKIDNLLTLMTDIQTNSFRQTPNSVFLISMHNSRSRTTRTRFTSTQREPINLSRTVLSNQEMQHLYQLFLGKCKDIHQVATDSNWKLFVKSFMKKNPSHSSQETIFSLNYSELSLGRSAPAVINAFLKQHPQIESINLSKNHVDPTQLSGLMRIKHLSLCNCGLYTQQLDPLFRRLLNSPLQTLILSSPQFHNRNKLPRSQALKELIKTNHNLHRLQLLNIELNPKSQLFQCCRYSRLQHLDLSHNPAVCGISPNLLSLSLAHNSLSRPFTLPMVENRLQLLDLTSNKIPCEHFAEFLKILYFPHIRTLKLDRLQLSEPVTGLQTYLMHASQLITLSMVGCDLSAQAYSSIAIGIKGSRSLEEVILSRTRFNSQCVAESLSAVIQYGQMSTLKLNNCDIKDQYGKLLLQNLHRSRKLQHLHLRHNFLSDLASQTLRNSLKQSQQLQSIDLSQNTMKYKDIREIYSYVSANRFHWRHSSACEYQMLQTVVKGHQSSMRNYEKDENVIIDLEREIIELKEREKKWGEMINRQRRIQCEQELQEIRRMEEELKKQLEQKQVEMFLRQSTNENPEDH